MKNFTCTKCGSNKLREEGKNYLCEYCGATIFKPLALPRKRLLFIIASLGILLVIATVGYKLLYSIKTDIQQMKNQAQGSQTQIIAQQNTIPTPVYTTEENPFADVILKVEGGYSTNDKGNSLENFIKAYQSFEMNKACYISLNKEGEYAFGYAYAAESTKIAEEQALKICQKEKEKSNLTESCIPYAVNNHLSRLIIGW